MKFKIIFLAVFFLCATSLFAHREVKELSLSAQGIEKLEIDCGAGFLKVYGKEGLKEIRVEAEIVLDGKSEKSAEEFIQKYLDLSLEKRGSRAVLTSGFESYRSMFSFGNKVVNLTVNMPKDMNLDVDDGSGSIRIEDIAGEVKVDDGSGSMEIMNIKGNLEVDDGSGEIDVEEINGNVSVDDGSGEISIEGVSGDVSVDDGSGSMIIRNIEGSVTVRDGSGSITIDGVEKDVYIPSDGSGSVQVKNVKGKVKY
ncbi:MAG: DUF4097 family beta strand repeat protein [Candidatus Aminicenantes bacterium]|nr:DUF4097 family beta strand repeat protein [Candidatus Aminicenantes bacterium]